MAMKRVKLKKHVFAYRPRRSERVSSEPRLRHDLDACDPIVAKLFKDIDIARELERVSWDRLARYLERKGAPPAPTKVPT
jgi:hypothetical protein